MDLFFERYGVLLGFKELFIQAGVTDCEFYNLELDRLSNILKGDMSAVTSFLPLYMDEKTLHLKRQNESLMDSSEDELHMSLLDDIPIIDVPSANDDSSSDVISSMSVVEETNPVADKVEDVKTSTHKIPENFEFIQNSLYFSLLKSIEGQLILGTYKHSSILLNRALKVFIIHKLVVENPFNYRIRKHRLEFMRDQLMELFPTIEKPTDWYKESYKNVFGQRVEASGCLVNYYKTIRQKLALAGMVNFSHSQDGIPALLTAPVTCCKKELQPLTDPDRSKYTNELVEDTWVKKVQTRMQILVERRKKKVIIHYQSYINTFVCLQGLSGIDLLESDSNYILEQLAASKCISKDISETFTSTFSTRWPSLAEIICRYAELSKVPFVVDFQKQHKNSITIVSKSVLALLYVACFLTKTTSIKDSATGTFTFSRNECVEHFIKIVENESFVDGYKSSFAKLLTDLHLPVAPYTIFLGSLDNITKAYVVVNTSHYEFQDPLKAVEACLKASIALHSWQFTCTNVWLYILEHVYKIRPNLSCAFPPTKATGIVSTFIKKLDPTFTTAVNITENES